MTEAREKFHGKRRRPFAFRLTVSGFFDMARERNRSAPRSKLLHALDQAIFAYESFAARIDGDGPRQSELACVGSVGSPLTEQFAVGRKMVHTLVMGLNHNNVALVVTAHAFWFSFVGL